MIELTWYQLTDPMNRGERKWYVRPVPKQTFGIREMANHMEQHNTPFSAGTIEGILTDFVKCVREQILNGNTVKIDDLAILKVSVESNSYETYGNQDKDGKPMAIAKIGNGNAVVKSTKLLAQATGEMMRDRLNLNAKFSWDTETQAELNKLKKDEDTPDDVTPPNDPGSELKHGTAAPEANATAPEANATAPEASATAPKDGSEQGWDSVEDAPDDKH